LKNQPENQPERRILVKNQQENPQKQNKNKTKTNKNKQKHRM